MHLLCIATEPVLIFILVLQFKLVEMIGGTFHIDNPGRFFQNINIRMLTVKE